MVGKNSKIDLDACLKNLNKEVFPWQIEKDCKKAAVLVPLLWKTDEWHLLFTRRTDTVQTHKGQVSFPGGQQDEEDVSPEATALREAWEEIGLQKDNVRIFGRLRDVESSSDFSITPVVGQILKPFDYQISTEEVSKVFSIPLAWVADRKNYSIGEYRSNGRVYPGVIYYDRYKGELLWGISARITLDFLDILNQ